MVVIAKVLIVTTSVVIVVVVEIAAATAVATADLAIDIPVAANPVVITVIIVTAVPVVAAVFVAVAVVVSSPSLSRSSLSLSPHASQHRGGSGVVGVEAAGAVVAMAWWQWASWGRCIGDGTGSMRWRATSGVAVTSRGADEMGRKGKKEKTYLNFVEPSGYGGSRKGRLGAPPRKAGMVDTFPFLELACHYFTNQSAVLYLLPTLAPHGYLRCALPKHALGVHASHPSASLYLVPKATPCHISQRLRAPKLLAAAIPTYKTFS
ncbi:hypothetical protein EDB85DRAFT_1885840 [Lactarius pseudohatsudake]|nr:hypothetical protein EDB85DRAFT_1885840 [Lactarius pseudohatsudake]